MQGKIGKAGWLSLTLAVMGAGCLYFSADNHELEPDQIVVRSEGITSDTLRWCFDADDTEGKPLETVFYTLECTPNTAENAVDVVVRLYDSPANGRRKLRRTGERGVNSAEFDLVYRLNTRESTSPSGISYRILFCGRNLGTWKAPYEPALAGTSFRLPSGL